MKALIIDDDMVVARSVQRLMSLLDMDVDVCDDRMSMVLLNDKEYDLIVCDMMMPSINGDEIYRRVPDAMKDKFVFFSGGTNISSAQQFCNEMNDQGRFFKKDRVQDLFLYITKTFN